MCSLVPTLASGRQPASLVPARSTLEGRQRRNKLHKSFDNSVVDTRRRAFGTYVLSVALCVLADATCLQLTGRACTLSLPRIPRTGCQHRDLDASKPEHVQMYFRRGLIGCFEVLRVTPLMPMALCASVSDGEAATASTRAASMDRICTSCAAGATPYLQMCAASHLCASETCCLRNDHCLARACCGRNKKSVVV